MDWKIYYSDNRSFASDDGLPKDAPGWGVQVIVEPDETVGAKTISRHDYYIFVDGHWIGVDFIGMIDYVVNILGIVKVGRMVQSKEFRAILDSAAADPNFPRKSAWYPNEARE